jgi:hypothetical protein
MARIRSIKPEFWKDGKTRRLSDSCALFFIGLWNFCDDEGKCPNDSFELASNLARFKSQHISKWIQILFNAGLIQLSTDFRWISIVNWKHQKIDKPRIPSVRKSEIEWLPVPEAELSTNARRMLHDSSANVRRKDRIGEDRKGSGEDHCDVPAVVAKPPRNPVEKKSEPSQANEILARYCECFKARYGSNPPIRGKEAGLAKRLAKDLPISRVLGLIETYLSMNDPYFVTRRHDLGTFSLSLNAVAVRHDTGLNLTQTEIRQADRAQATANAFDFALANFRGPSNGNV